MSFNIKSVDEAIRKGLVLPTFKVIEIVERKMGEIGKKKSISKFDLFDFLKKDYVFRAEVGTKLYSELFYRVQNLPEKCKPHVTNNECRLCTTNRTNLCVVNVIGIISGSEVMAHHGHEYSDLLIITHDNQEIIPIIAKGNERLTEGNDKGLNRQVQEKCRDGLISTIIIACSGQIANPLVVNLRQTVKAAEKQLIFITSKDLIQFIYKLDSLT